MCSRESIGHVLISSFFGGCGRKDKAKGELENFNYLKEINLVKGGKRS